MNVQKLGRGVLCVVAGWMLTAPIAVTAIVLSAGSAIAQTEAKPSSLSFLVKEKSTRSKPVDRWRTDWGAYNQDTHRSKTVEVEVRNFSGFPANNIKLTVAWLARARERGDAPYIVELGTNQISAATKTTFVIFESPSVTENRVNYGYGHTSAGYATGSKLIGYIVSMEYAGNVYPAYASAGVGEFAKEPKFSSLMEAYKKDSGSRGSRR